MATPDRNKQIVLEAFETLFNKRDYKAAARFWSQDYIQHSAHIEPGHNGLFRLIKSLPDTLRYENALVVAEGDFVFLHGRFSGHGGPRAWIAVDIVRMQDDILAEHWEGLQDGASWKESRSGRPVFGKSFAVADAADSPLTVEEARMIVAQLYDELNEPATKHAATSLAKTIHRDDKSNSTNEGWLSRDQLADLSKTPGAQLSRICAGQSRISRSPTIRSWCAVKRPRHQYASCLVRNRSARALRQ